MAPYAGSILSDFLGIIFTNNAQRTRGMAEEGLDQTFIPHYKKFLKPLVSEFEENRLSVVQKVRFRGQVAFACIVAACGFIFYLNHFQAVPVFSFGPILLMIGGLGLFIYAYLPIIVFKGNIKGRIYPLIFRFFGDSFSYSQKPTLTAKSLKSSGILPYFDDESNEDYICGTYKEITLELMESVLTKEVRTERQGKSEKRTEEVFRGLFIVFSLHKNFQGQTIVRRDSGCIGNWLLDKTSKLETVHLEDPVFEDKFLVMSSDQIEARYLLTTSFMERLLQVENAFKTGEFLGGGQLQCSFYNNRLLFAIPSLQNRFEVGQVGRPMTFVTEINQILTQMRLIFSIIDTLKLDENTGL